ncbi:hypothetical protein ACJRO7_031974 [Eucalyptus globulus]|uniref:Uncharacterized protein n=1 Tax=Eucalyptus globulus TaxID=34317 RepID=A0ABD3JKG2_EUCGL
MPVSTGPVAGDSNHVEIELTEKEMIEDKLVETELSQAIADDTSRRVIFKHFIPVHSLHIQDSFSSFHYPVMITHPVQRPKIKGINATVNHNNAKCP